MTTVHLRLFIIIIIYYSSSTAVKGREGGLSTETKVVA